MGPTFLETLKHADYDPTILLSRLTLSERSRGIWEGFEFLLKLDGFAGLHMISKTEDNLSSIVASKWKARYHFEPI